MPASVVISNRPTPTVGPVTSLTSTDQKPSPAVQYQRNRLSGAPCSRSIQPESPRTSMVESISSGDASPTSS